MENALSNMVSEDIKHELLSLKKDDLTVSYIMKEFGSRTSKAKDGEFNVIPPRFIQSKKIRLSKGEYINKTDIVTNVGLLLFNKLLIENRFEDVIPNGYWNTPLDKKAFGNLIDILSNAVLNGKFNVEVLAGFLKDYEFYGLKLVTVFSPSYTLNMIMPEENVNEEKEKLLKEHPNPSIAEMTKIEDTLVATSKNNLKDDSGMVLYKSGARGDFSNDHKNMILAVGPVNNPVTGKYEFMKSNYMDGIAKEDLVKAGNIIVTSEYPKSVGTQVGGYLTKQFYAVFQSIVIDEPGTDCGTAECIHVFLDESNIESFYDQYIRLNDGKLVLLSEDNANEFINSTQAIRSPMFCLNEKICNHCAGERFNRLGVKSAGLTTTQISGKILNASLKKRHSMKSKMDNVDIHDLLIG